MNKLKRIRVSLGSGDAFYCYHGNKIMMGAQIGLSNKTKLLISLVNVFRKLLRGYNTKNYTV